MIKNNPNIKGLNMFDQNYLYAAYADDTYFLNDQKSISELMKTFKLFAKSCKCELQA